MSHASSFEQPSKNQNNVSEKEHEAFTVSETNLMQLSLMKDFDGEPTEWIETYSQAFRDLIKNESSLHDLYVKEPEVCLAYIKKCLENPVHH